MDDKIDSASALIDLEAAVSMVSLNEAAAMNDVFLAADDLLPPPPSALLVGSGSDTSMMDSMPSSNATETASSSFEYGEDPFLGRPKLSAVVLKPLDPMWDSAAGHQATTPEPAMQVSPSSQQRYHHAAKYDPQFVEDLLFLSSHSPSPSCDSDPFQMMAEGPPRKVVRARSSVSESRDTDHHVPAEIDCSVDGQKVSSISPGREHKGYWPIKRSSHRAKHSSAEDKGKSSHSPHHFHDFVHYLRKFSHGGSHKDIQLDDCKEATEDRPSGSKMSRFHRNSVGSRPSSANENSAEFRVRAHSTGGGGGVRPKKRPGTIQAVYSIYDNIVKEGKHGRALVRVCWFSLSFPFLSVLLSSVRPAGQPDGFLKYPLDGFVGLFFR